jgi:acetylglutamate kinase
MTPARKTRTEESARTGARAVAATGPIVIKLGGRALETPDAARELARELIRLSGGTLVVHGGGAEVTDWCARLGIEPRFHDGLRVTDAATLDVATAVLAGLANKRLVATLRDAGVDAVGLSAVDGGVIDVEPHPDAARLGAVGQVTAVHPHLLESLLAHGRVPVLASIGAAGGALLNVNADDLAAAVAGALRARALVLLSDTPGLKLDGEVVARVAAGEVVGLLARDDVQGGMRPKLRAAATALEIGAGRVTIGAWNGAGTLAALMNGNGGTTLVADTLEATRG